MALRDARGSPLSRFTNFCPVFKGSRGPGVPSDLRSQSADIKGTPAMLIKTPFFANATRVVTLALAMGAVCVTAATADVKLKFDKNGRDSVRVGGNNARVKIDGTGDVCTPAIMLDSRDGSPTGFVQQSLCVTNVSPGRAQYQYKTLKMKSICGLAGDPTRTRTLNLLIRSQLLK